MPTQYGELKNGLRAYITYSTSTQRYYDGDDGAYVHETTVYVNNAGIMAPAPISNNITLAKGEYGLYERGNWVESASRAAHTFVKGNSDRWQQVFQDIWIEDYEMGHSAYTVPLKIRRESSPVYQTTATITIPAKPSYTVSYNPNGGSGAPGSQTKWADERLTLSSTRPTRAGYTFAGWATSSGGSVAYQPGGSYTANSAVTLYAKWNANPYAITYNANGGTGAPGPQTKYHGTNLTLSSTKPTRANYTFLGWATSKDGSVAYRPGDTYSANAPVTLYAVWKPFEYAVIYNGNGGIGEPGQQIKYYGTDLTLSAIRPTRAGYTFLGWAASAAGSVEYQPGGTYSDNTQITLYAVWKAYYTYNLETVRVNASGGVTEDPNGEWIFIKANITTEDHADNPISAYHFTDNDSAATVGWYENTDKTGDVTFPYQPAANIFTLYAWYHADTEKHELSARFDTSYTIGVVISVIVSPIFRTLDFLAGGKGVAIGKRATQEGLDVEMDALFRNDLKVEGHLVNNNGTRDIDLNISEETIALFDQLAGGTSWRE